jgi:MFS family permease
MLADSVDPAERGKAFGFHRAGDTLGAVVGPLLGVWLLSRWQGNALEDASLPFRNIFLLTLIPGLLSVLAFVVLVKEKRGTANRALQFWGTIRMFPRGFRRFLVGAGIFGLGDVAPTLLILAATQLLTPEFGIVRAAQLAGLMYVVRNVTYALASLPIGALSDRIGRTRLLAAGYLVGVVTIGGFALAFVFAWSDPVILFLLFALAGIFIAAEDTLEGAVTADFIPAETRGIGMGVLGTVNGVGDLWASVVVGIVWTAASGAVAFALASAMMLAGTIMIATVREKV